MAYQDTKDKYNLAIIQDASIVATPETLDSHPGSPLERLLPLGLDRPSLKRLERLGLAIRAYTKNIWTVGESVPKRRPTDPDYVVKPGESFRGKGHRVKWILLKGFK